MGVAWAQKDSGRIGRGFPNHLSKDVVASYHEENAQPGAQLDGKCRRYCNIVPFL